MLRKEREKIAASVPVPHQKLMRYILRPILHPSWNGNLFFVCCFWQTNHPSSMEIKKKKTKTKNHLSSSHVALFYFDFDNFHVQILVHMGWFDLNMWKGKFHTWHFQRGSVRRRIRASVWSSGPQENHAEMRSTWRQTKEKSNARVHNSTSLMSACVFRKRFASCRNDSKAFVPKWNCN